MRNIGKNNIFDAEKYSDWCNFKIKAVLYPEKLTEREKQRSIKFVPEKRRGNKQLLKEQIEVLREYERKRRVEDNLNEKTMAMRLSQISVFADFVGKPFDKVNKDDVLNFFESLKGLKPGSINNYKSAIKTFFQWFYGMTEKEYPEIVGWLKRKNSRGLKLPEEILTEEEIARMVSKADNSRDKAIISVLYESG